MAVFDRPIADSPLIGHSFYPADDSQSIDIGVAFSGYYLRTYFIAHDVLSGFRLTPKRNDENPWRFALQFPA